MNTIGDIRAQHRERRYAMKIQQKIDRALESFVRINCTGWTPDADEKMREKFNREVKAIITAARKGQGDARIITLVAATDQGRKPFDAIRKETEANMEGLARELPVFPWIKNVNGAAELGLATIVAEAGDLSNYPNIAKLWKRLGFAPYDGCAGSTWKRETWRPRALTKEEWIANPFSGERYALMIQIAQSLWFKQWMGKAKTGNGEGQPNGPYGEVYAARRKHTASTHPEWSKGHSHSDAIRIMMKAFLKDLWIQWRRCAALAEQREAAE